MQLDRYEQAARLFQEALDLPADRRRAHVQAAAGDDRDLAARVQRMLAWADRDAPTDAFMPDGAPGAAGTDEGRAVAADAVHAQAHARLIGATIGPYRLERLVGEGGFGAVFQARQEHPVRRSVALKILKSGMDSQQVVARFEAERQALALMEHPGIARVIDAGQTDEALGARPFVVMEFVTGEPITQYCDRRSLDLAARLELFSQVCHAVQHAHHKGVIHRDLKPSNILVSEIDGKPLPKVIDFGVAKAIRQPLTQALLVTNRMELLGTPAYMSPEQADSDERAIDTRSDVYSLGVVLYELLTGTTPLDQHTLASAGYTGMLRAIRDQRLERPSARLARLSQASATEGVQPPARAGDVRARSKRLRGELDWIVLKALEPQRERRYDSAAALADDLRRYMNRQPVEAGPPSAAYRLRTFIRRHRVGVAATALVTVAVIAGSVGTVLGLVRSMKEAAKAQQIAEFTQQMLSGIDPAVAQGMDTALLRTILEDTAERIDNDLASQPEVEAAIRNTIGRTYFALSEYDAAEPHLRRSLAIRQEILGEDHPDTLDSMANLGLVLRGQGKLDEATTLLGTTLEKRRSMLGDDHLDTLKSQNYVANLMWDDGRLAQAETEFVDVLEKSRRLLGPDHPTTLVAINNMGAILKEQGKLSEAEPYHHQALEGERRIHGPDHPSTLAAMSNMGRLLGALGRLDESEGLLRQSVDDYRRVMGADHAQTLGAINSLGAVLQRQNRLAEATGFYREVLDARRRTLGDDHPDTLLSMNNYGSIMSDQGKMPEAESWFRLAIEAQSRTIGREHPDTLRSVRNLGWVLEQLGKSDEAAACYSEALAGRRRVLGNDSPLTVSTMMVLASLLLKPTEVNDPGRALELALEANTLTRFSNPDHLDTLATAYSRTGEIAKAIETQQKAIGMLPADSTARQDFEQRLQEYESAMSGRQLDRTRGPAGPSAP